MYYLYYSSGPMFCKLNMRYCQFTFYELIEERLPNKTICLLKHILNYNYLLAYLMSINKLSRLLQKTYVCRAL